MQGAGPSVLLHRAVRRPSGREDRAKVVSKHCDRVSYFRIHRGKRRTQGTETSKYLQERTSTETPLVVASERGPGQWRYGIKRKDLERSAIVGDSPVRVEVHVVLE